MPLKLDITARRPSEIPSEDAIISAARILIEDSLSWTQGKAYASRTVQTSHEVLPDGCSWHSRSSAHSLPFDQFWSVLGHQWMPAKKAFNDEYIHEIEKVTLVKTLSSTTSIWTIQYKFPPPLSPRVFTILQVTRLDDAYPRIGWVVHLPIDLTGPGDEALLAQEGHGIKGRYACVEKITQLPDGRTEWRLVTSNTPGGWIPKFLVEKTLPARISLDVISFVDWYNTIFLRTHKIASEPVPHAPNSAIALSLATIGWGLALLNVAVYAIAYHSPWAARLPVRATLSAIWVQGVCAIYLRLTTPNPNGRDIVPKPDRLLIGMRDPLIPATIELGRPLSLEQATSLVSSRLLAIPRMSHRLVLPSASAPYWEPYANIDLATHISEHTLPPESGYAELRRLIESLGRKRVDPSRPPWDIALIQRGPERGSILFARVHHAITDGRGLTAILTACADEPRSALILPRAPSAPPRARGVFGAIAQATRNVADLRNLDRPVEKLTSIKRAEPLAVPALAWVQHPFVLAELKCMAQRLGGGTVNDVVLAAVAGALRMYMRAHGDDVDSASVQCKIPVDRLKAGEAGEVVLGTHLGDMNVLLPVDVGTPEGRYDRVCATMRQAKAGYQVGIAAAMSGVVGGLATTTRLALIAADARTVSCYVSNMKGPPSQMHVADGNPVMDVRCHPLALNNIGVGIAVYSYDGRVNIAVCTDSELIPEPDVLCGFLEDEVRLLAAASIARLRYAVCAVPAVSPKFSSEYSVVIPHPIEVASPVLFPADASAISRFLVGTRDASLKVAADFIHHSTDFVRMDIRAAFAADALPAIHALPACDVDDVHDQSITDIPVLQRDCFTVIERIPMMFGLFKQTVTVKAWQVLDPARGVAAYESVVAGAGVRVWKVRELADAGKDGTRVKETLKGTCPWILQGIVRKDSLVAHRATMDRYCAML